MHWNVGTAAVDQTEFLSPGQPFGYLIKICSLISGESDGAKQAKNENWRCEGGRLEMTMDGEGGLGYYVHKGHAHVFYLAFLLRLPEFRINNLVKVPTMCQVLCYTHQV